MEKDLAVVISQLVSNGSLFQEIKVLKFNPNCWLKYPPPSNRINLSQTEKRNKTFLQSKSQVICQNEWLVTSGKVTIIFLLE